MKRREFLKGCAILPAATLIPISLVAQPVSPLQQRMVDEILSGRFVVSNRRAGKSYAARLAAIQLMKQGRQVHYITPIVQHAWANFNEMLKEDKAVSMIPQRGFIDTVTGGSILTYNIFHDRSYLGISDWAIIDEPDLMRLNAFLSMMAREGVLTLSGIGTPLGREKNLWRVQDRTTRVINYGQYDLKHLQNISKYMKPTTFKQEYYAEFV